MMEEEGDIIEDEHHLHVTCNCNFAIPSFIHTIQVPYNATGVIPRTIRQSSQIPPPGALENEIT